MSILDLGPTPKEKSVGKQSKRILLGFGLLMAIVGIGSTFASTISINAGQEIEFGQGVQRSVFCGGEESITITPISEFVNGGENDEDLGSFGFTGITISDIPANCSDRNFIIKVYGDEAGSLPLEMTSGFPIANVWWAAGCPEDESCRVAGTEDGATYLSSMVEGYQSFGNGDVIATSNSFTLTFSAPQLSSNDVSKIVVETQNDTFGYELCLADGICIPA